MLDDTEGKTVLNCANFGYRNESIELNRNLAKMKDVWIKNDSDVAWLSIVFERNTMFLY